MKNFYLILFSVIFASMLSSCKNKKDALMADFEKFIQKASVEYQTTDEKGWTTLTDQYEKLMKRYEKLEKKLSNIERKAINEYQGRFFSIRMKYEANRIKELLKKNYEKIKGFADELLRDP